jgi:methionyl-tRNA formyltransferase
VTPPTAPRRSEAAGSSTPLRLIFAGSGEFGLPLLRALSQGPHRLVEIYSQPDRQAGRGRGFTPTPISKWAEENFPQVPLVRTPNINQAVILPADLLIVVAFGQKIATHVVNTPRLGSINLHASRLPRYRGAAPINWAILRGETHTGNSVIRLADRMDAGAILAMSTIEIGPTETAGELHDRLAADGAEVVQGVIAALSAGVAVETPQDESLATLAPKLDRSAARLVFSRPADQLGRQIRGLHPWPGCRVVLADAAGGEIARMRLVRAVAAADDEGPRWQPGEIMLDGRVHTPSGALELLEVQPEGGKPMGLSAYRRGNPWPPGARLSSL